MKHFLVVMMMALALWVRPVAADDPSIGCQAVAVAIGASVGARLAIWAGATAAGMGGVTIPAVTTVLGEHSLSQPCQDLSETVYDHLEIISRTMPPQTYEDWVEHHCNGNEYSCGAPLDPFDNPFEEPNPWEGCYWSIDCQVGILMQTKPQGFSVNDLLNAATFIDYSLWAHSWQIQQYGYLIGLPTTRNTGSYFEPY